MFGQEVHIEERSFVAKGAPLDDGQKRVGDGKTLRQSRIVKSRSPLRFGMTCFAVE
jgi:hypothetical protein